MSEVTQRGCQDFESLLKIYIALYVEVAMHQARSFPSLSRLVIHIARGNDILSLSNKFMIENQIYYEFSLRLESSLAGTYAHIDSENRFSRIFIPPAVELYKTTSILSLYTSKITHSRFWNGSVINAYEWQYASRQQTNKLYIRLICIILHNSVFC